MLSRTIGDYHFLADKDSGVTFRWGKTTMENPSFAPVPELADISISNRCSKGCGFCYRASTRNGALMTVEDYCHVIDSMNHPIYGNVFQVAIGGGEPLEHPEFMTIIDETVKRGIIPNFTTNGRLLTENILDAVKEKVGALAVSVTDIQETERLRNVLSHKHKTRVNLHYILSEKTIDQATDMLKGKYNQLLTGVNAIVFLTYKPAGRGNMKDVLKDGKNLQNFIRWTKCPNTICKIGFDACFVPMLLKNTSGLNDFVDSCEGGFFSVYINEQKEVSPCSFSNGKDSYSLDEFDFYDIWLQKLQPFRDRQINNCTADCKARSMCRGACVYYPQVTACYQG